MEAFKAESRPIINDVEYRDEIVAHMHHMESETLASVELMDVQPELKWFMRPYLVDFIVEIHQTFRLRPETLYLTMNIVDRYVSKRIVYKRHFQLVGCAALLIAAKFEDAKDRVPTVAELSQMCCSAYDDSAFTQMEGHVLSTIGWCLGFPTPEAWLRLACLERREETATQSVARFLMELSLFQRDFIGLAPSHLAAGALMLARFICGQSAAARPHPFDSDDAAVTSAAQLIDNFVRENLSELSLILVKKYSFSHFSNASTLVRHFYTAAAARASAGSTSSPGSDGLLPAQAVTSAFERNSFTTPRRGGNATVDDDDDMSTRSGSASPASLASSPSHSGDEDEDDDCDMPVTPLSLNSLHDPLLATVQHSAVGVKALSKLGAAGKENRSSKPAPPAQPVFIQSVPAAVSRPALGRCDNVRA